jgi:hypothetical protein
MKKYFLFTLFFLFFISISLSQTSFFKPVANNGFRNDHIIAIPLSCNPNINSAALADGDEIGVFNSAGKCFGAVVWKKVATAIIAKGNTGGNDGFNSNDLIKFRIYSKLGKKAYYATVEFDPTLSAGVFRVDGISALKSLKGTTAVLVDENIQTPINFMLAQNYPNPFNPTTQINFSIPAFSNVSVIIYDLTGKEISRVINNENRTAGNYQVEWNGVDSRGKKVSSGIYFYKLEVFTSENGTNKNSFNQVKSMLLTK